MPDDLLPSADRVVARTAAAGADPAVVLLIERTKPVGATLVRYAASGAALSDSWYLTAEEARACAVRDYGERLGPWRVLPAGAADPVAFALSAPSAPGADRGPEPRP